MYNLENQICNKKKNKLQWDQIEHYQYIYIYIYTLFIYYINATEKRFEQEPDGKLINAILFTNYYRI